MIYSKYNLPVMFISVYKIAKTTLLSKLNNYIYIPVMEIQVVYLSYFFLLIVNGFTCCPVLF